MSYLAQRLGLQENVKNINVIAYCLSSCVTIICLVFFIGSTQGLLRARLGAHSDSRIGGLIGKLVLADEAVAIPSVVAWGALADKFGVRVVTSIGHIVTSVGLVAFASCRREWHFYCARAVLSVGTAALTCMLAAVLASMSALPTKSAELPNGAQSEDSPLMQTPSRPSEGIGRSRKSAQLAGAVSFCGGLGALISAFGFLRLPLALRPHHIDLGVISSFWFAALVPGCTGVILLFALQRRGEPFWLWIPSPDRPSTAFRWVQGFRHAAAADVAVTFLAGFAARAISNTAVLFLPGFVNAALKCHIGEGGDDERCRVAVALASSLTGTVQLASLLAAPFIGWLASKISLDLLLAWILLFGGTVGYLIIGLLPSPQSFWIWPACVLAGCAQSGSIVISLAMVARVRVRLLAKAALLGSSDEEEIAGALAGAFSACGAAGVLISGTCSGFASDFDLRWPFRIAACASILPVVFIIVSRLWKRKTKGDDEMHI